MSVAAFWITPENPLCITNMLYIIPELCRSERERGMQVRVKEAKSMLSCYLSIQVNYMFICEDLALGFEVSFSSEFFTLELYLCQIGNPCWKKSTLKANYSAVATDQCSRLHLPKLELTMVEFNLAVFLLNRQTAKLNSPDPIPAVLWLHLKYYKTCALT